MITRIADNLQTNWKKELASAVSDPEVLFRQLDIDPELVKNHFAARKLFPVRVPQPFINKMQKGNLNDPLLKQVMPRSEEFNQVEGFSLDPLHEQQAAAPGLLHKYKSRVLLILRGGCAVNCRYCFRRHFPYSDNTPNKKELAESLDYIRANPQINEVILSGGDPLMANDDYLAWLIGELESIPQIKRFRIHTRLPVVIPQRITPRLAELLGNSRLPCVFVTHINHANEIDSLFKQTMSALRQNNITLFNQAVLLQGINDNVESQVALSESLFAAGILPYYLHLLDKVQGAAHFDVSEDKAVSIMAGVLEELPGFLVPKLTRENAEQPSKTPIDLRLTP